MPEGYAQSHGRDRDIAGQMNSKQIDLEDIDAMVFDMDGVLTDTASIHAEAWKRMFDEYLKKRAARTGEDHEPFDRELDYLEYVDGKPRYDGVESFLESRGISIPHGDPGDDPSRETVCGLGNRKNRYFLQLLRKGNVRPYESSVEFTKALKRAGIRAAVISASRNAEDILKAAGIRGLFDIKVDGVDSDELELDGKPNPAIFLEAAGRLGIEPSRAGVVEDSLAGVEAGRRGRFRLVVGVDRANQSRELKNRGADIVVKDLSQLEIGEPFPSQ